MVNVAAGGHFVEKPFTVPEDGWILSVSFFAPENKFIKIDGQGGVYITPSQKVEGYFLTVDGGTSPVVESNLNCPYPVKKGQIVKDGIITAPQSVITFAPCMSV